MTAVIHSTWSQCSCCDGVGCAGGTTGCGDPASFCSIEDIGLTCKEWGNPICDGVTVTETGVSVTICDMGNCASTLFSDAFVYCDNKDNSAATKTCQSATFQNSEAVCDSGACLNANFEDSEVSCSALRGGSSCDNSVFNKTMVTCSDDTCDNSDFHTSAVTCSDYDSCDTSTWSQCSCCDGLGCAGGTTGCGDPAGFCSIEVIGRTCKEWGNPICDGVTVTETGVSVTICDMGNCASTLFSDAFVYCDNKDNSAATKTCQSATFQNSEAVCDSGACLNANFEDSEVSCSALRGGSSCDGGTFSRTAVTCNGDTCDGSNFMASAVTCSDYDSCDSATFDGCSCCNGIGCPSSTSSCTDAEGFCSLEVNGMTCAALGNPICGSPVESSPVSPSTGSPVVLPAPAPVVPVSPPTEPPVSPPTDPPVEPPPTPTTDASPVAPPVSPPTEPPVTTVSPTMQPTLDTLCGINNINLVAGESTTVPPCIDNVDRVTVTLWPINGSLTVKEDGSVVYTPNPDFQGEDRFATETCDVDGSCFAMTVVMQVATAAPVVKSGGGGSSGSLVALSALAVIPIGIIGYLLYRKQRSGSGPHGKRAATEINAPASDFDQSGGQPNLPTHEVASGLPQPPVRQSGRQSGGGYMPRNKDQAQSVLPPSSEAPTVTTSVDSNSGVRSSAQARASQDPPEDPLAAATVHAVPMPVNRASDGYLPAVKDQCREAIPGRQSDDPPLANAIVIDASDVEGGGGKS